MLARDESEPRVTSPALRYFGGKWRLAPWVITALPPHRCYVEPFGGGASVLLRKPRSEVEVYNDRAGEVVNFFRVVRDRGRDLVEALESTPFAADEYLEACAMVGEGSELERARRFFVVAWGGFQGSVGGATRKRGWRRTKDRNVAHEMRVAAEGLRSVADRLRGVAVDNLDWREILRRYDGPQTCFYLDPPYVLASRADSAPSSGYGPMELTDSDHAELLEAVLRLEGSAVISGYSSPLYEERLERLERRAHNNKGTSQEVLWIKHAAAAPRQLGLISQSGE